MTLQRLTADWRAHERQSQAERNHFAEVRRAGRVFGRQLRALAVNIGALLAGYDPNNPEQMQAFIALMEQYAETLTPWARNAAENMLVDVANRDYSAWMRHSEQMGKAIRQEIEQAPIGAVMRGLQEEQVVLIKSLPLEAAQRVHKLATEARISGARPEGIAREIMRTGEVTASRAALIAHTEVGRAATNLTQARSLYVGATSYKWLTAADNDVRPSHKAMAGKIVEWANPPTLDGLTGHAGSLPNCRCIPRPELP